MFTGIKFRQHVAKTTCETWRECCFWESITIIPSLCETLDASESKTGHISLQHKNTPKTKAKNRAPLTYNPNISKPPTNINQQPRLRPTVPGDISPVRSSNQSRRGCHFDFFVNDAPLPLQTSVRSICGNQGPGEESPDRDEMNGRCGQIFRILKEEWRLEPTHI